MVYLWRIVAYPQRERSTFSDNNKNIHSEARYTNQQSTIFGNVNQVSHWEWEMFKAIRNSMVKKSGHRALGRVLCRLWSASGCFFQGKLSAVAISLACLNFGQNTEPMNRAWKWVRLAPCVSRNPNSEWVLRISLAKLEHRSSYSNFLPFERRISNSCSFDTI